MITTTMRRLVPEEFISPLKTLGKYDWLRWTPLDTTPPSTTIELRLPNDPVLLKCPRLIRFLSGLASEQSGDLFAIYVQSKALAEGPKLLCPTTEQCEALEHVDVNISFDDYVRCLACDIDAAAVMRGQDRLAGREPGLVG
jgi:hypothetical protein